MGISSKRMSSLATVPVGPDTPAPSADKQNKLAIKKVNNNASAFCNFYNFYAKFEKPITYNNVMHLQEKYTLSI